MSLQPTMVIWGKSNKSWSSQLAWIFEITSTRDGESTGTMILISMDVVSQFSFVFWDIHDDLIPSIGIDRRRNTTHLGVGFIEVPASQNPDHPLEFDYFNWCQPAYFFCEK